MRWLNEPRQWSVSEDVLAVTADPDTDFWRTTHYGYVTDSGHLYGADISGDFDLRVVVDGAYAHQYDQAGAMVRVDDQYWLKTGIEFVDGRACFSTVVTNGYSSWAVAELPVGCTKVGLRLARRGDSVEVRYLAGDRYEHADAMNLAAVAYLPPGRPVLAGAMCAAPTGGGFAVSFHDLSVVPTD
jgi:regulation of enolase protein 1 (concanavalin A-like superfamily)